MRHNLRRVLHLTEARTFWVRAVRAWRDLLPDWTPTLDALRALDTRPHEHVAAVRIVAEGWEPNDPRWDVLMALLEWERRNADHCRYGCRDAVAALSRLDQEMDEQQDHPNGFLCQRHGVDDCFCSGAPDYELPKDTPSLSDMVIAERDADREPKTAIIPVKVVTSQGQTLSETTLETPIKAAFLDRLTPVKHLREKGTDA